MATIDVKDASGNTVAIEKPLAPGRTGAAASRPVALSTEDLAVLSSIDTRLTTLAGYVDGMEALATALNGYVDGLEALIGSTNTALTSQATLTGAVNETAPASDTASSGLNGRLQRIAQNLTTLLGAGATTIAKAEDAASANADVGVPAMAVRMASPADTSGADGDYEMLKIWAGRLLTSAVGDTRPEAGGIPQTARMASSAASTNATRVTGVTGRVYQVCGKNNAAYDIFLVLYASNANPPVPGTTTIRKKLVCPAGQAFVYEWPGTGMSFLTGIGYAFTKNVADADTTAIAAGDITAFNVDFNG